MARTCLGRPHIARESGDNPGTIGVNIAHGHSSSDELETGQKHAMAAMTCELRPRIGRGGVSNPSMTSDDSDDVLTQTTHRARARKDVEPVDDNRR